MEKKRILNLRRKFRTTILGATMLSLALAVAGTANADDYVVVTHKDNSDSGGAQLVKSMFLKTRTKWPNGADSKPYGRKPNSDARAALLKMLGMSDAALAKHWLSLKQKTGQSAPKEVRSDKMVLKLVAKHEGGFGIVEKKAAEKSDKVKILMEIK